MRTERLQEVLERANGILGGEFPIPTWHDTTFDSHSMIVALVEALCDDYDDLSVRYERDVARMGE